MDNSHIRKYFYFPWGIGPSCHDSLHYQNCKYLPGSICKSSFFAYAKIPRRATMTNDPKVDMLLVICVGLTVVWFC